MYIYINQTIYNKVNICDMFLPNQNSITQYEYRVYMCEPLTLKCTVT